MQFRMLGPIEVVAGHTPVALGGSKPRALLAALLLENQHVVPMARLIDVMWGEDPPGRAKSLVQSHVFTLRSALAAAGWAAALIGTRARAYVGRMPAGSIDRAEGRRCREGGREAPAGGDAAKAARLLQKASGLWRGA